MRHAPRASATALTITIEKLLLAGCVLMPPASPAPAAPSPAPIATPSASQPTAAPTSPAPVQPSPTPTAGPTPAEVVASSWLASAAPLQSVGCPAASQGELGSLAGVTAYYESVLPCLQAAWSQADPQLTPALLVVFSGPAPADSCGPGSTYSFSCSGSGTIYLDADEMIAPWNQYSGDAFSHGITRLAATWVLAHEHGHHVQNVVGVFGALEDGWPGTETERRLELQASCLADVFLSSQADAYPVAPDYWAYQDAWRFVLRVPNHGSEANQQLWTDRGLASAHAAACDAFAAPAAEVA